VPRGARTAFRSDGIDSLLSGAANRTEVRNIVANSTRQHAALAPAVAAGDVPWALVEGTAHLASVDRCLVDRLV